MTEEVIQDIKAEEKDPTKEVFKVSSNLTLTVQSNDGSPVTVENITYALKVANLIFDYNFTRNYISEVKNNE